MIYAYEISENGGSGGHCIANAGPTKGIAESSACVERHLSPLECLIRALLFILNFFP